MRAALDNSPERMATARVRVMLVDDHRLIRAGIRSLLSGIDGVDVIGEADTGREALAMAAATEPDVVILDVGLPELNGLEVAGRLAKEHPRVRVMILSMHTDRAYVRRALQAGATAYLIKGADVPELELALKAVMRGDTYLSPGISRGLVGDYLRGGGIGNLPQDALTRRQTEVLQLIAEGNSTKAIAKQLQVSVKTVESHRAELMDRLNIHDVAGLVRYAIRAGVISADR